VIVDELMQRVRAAAFQVPATGRPAPIASLAAASGIGESEVRAAAGRLLAAGRARIDEHGNVTAAAGLSVKPKRHRIRTRQGSCWSDCAYDAPGILGALGADGENGDVT
jgi:hypothetical protein